MGQPRVEPNRVKVVADGVCLAAEELWRGAGGIRYNLGASPGFCLAFAQGLKGSVVVTIPEPGTLAVMGLGLFTLGAFVRRRQ
jgi:hypothetical protein